MSGKRVLDAIKLFNASRSVASKHFGLRATQLDVFTRTSTLAKAVKSQTDRVVLTAQAASALARRFNEESPAPAASTYTTQTPTPTRARPQQQQHIPSRESVEGSSTVTETPKKQGLEQDHFYERSTDNSLTDPVPDGDLSIRQEAARKDLLPDGTIPADEAATEQPRIDQDVHSERPQSGRTTQPLEGDEKAVEGRIRPVTSNQSSIPIPTRSQPLSTNEAKKLQRESELQIPSQTAEASPNASKQHLENGHDLDTFYTRSTITSAVDSSLPRAKIPRATAGSQEGDSHVADDGLNADVFYKPGQNQSANVAEGLKDGEDPSEDLIKDIFQSPRVARMLSNKNRAATRQHIPSSNIAQSAPAGAVNPAESIRGETVNTNDAIGKPGFVVSQAAAREPVEEDPEVAQLGADLAADVASVPMSEATQELGQGAETPAYKLSESRVPSSRLGRLWQYGGLATSMAFGAVGEGFKRVTGSGMTGGSLVLSPGNIERLVAKLSRMRGAALKLGQMISFQDSKMLPPAIHEVLQRVQDSADYMPASQRDKVLVENLGPNWRDHFSSFEEIPMAAASIGQVHGAILKSTGQPVAVKVQYPGVANSIDSDLNNLSILLTASRLLPRGLYLDKTIANARTELAWECDYTREAECLQRFKDLLADETATFTVPAIISSASGPQVLTMERMTGTAVTKVKDLTQTQKDHIGTQILRLCLREIFEFQFMQTDPNWTNFLYNASNQKLELLDFGASRDFPSHFTTLYINILRAAARGDRDAIRTLSIDLGYLTGHETKAMTDAHITSVLTLAEPFTATAPEVYDFQDQTITERVRGLIPVMMRERLAPPPEETYSLHRKLSGAFLLCARLGSRVGCRELFDDAVRGWKERQKGKK